MKIFDGDGTQLWYKDGLLHREDGHLQWYRDGKVHRDDGPAVILPDGTCFWYLNDYMIIDKDRYQKEANLTDEEMLFILLKYPFD